MNERKLFQDVKRNNLNSTGNFNNSNAYISGS